MTEAIAPSSTVFARRTVGWRVGRAMPTDCVLDVLAQALPYAIGARAAYGSLPWAAAIVG